MFHRSLPPLALLHSLCTPHPTPTPRLLALFLPSLLHPLRPLALLAPSLPLPLLYAPTRTEPPSRFLRARKFAIEPAYDQLVSTDKWRRDNRIEALYEQIDVDEYDKTRRLVSSFSFLSTRWAFGIDRRRAADGGWSVVVSGPRTVRGRSRGLGGADRGRAAIEPRRRTDRRTGRRGSGEDELCL